MQTLWATVSMPLVAVTMLVTRAPTVHGATVNPASAPYQRSLTAAGSSYLPVFSTDGQSIAFLSHANNLTTNDDQQPYLDLFVRDRLGGAATLVSVSTNGVGGANDNVRSAVLSSNGQFIAFATDASNLAPADTNQISDVYYRDRVAGRTTLISVNAAGTAAGDGPSFNPLISADGRYVIFESLASNLVTNDFNGTNDIFIRDTVAGVTSLVSVNAMETSSPPGPSFGASISENGLTVAFVSYATNVVAGVTNTLGEIYVRDVLHHSNRWAVASHLSATRLRGPASGLPLNYRATNPQLTVDGRYVVFQTDTATVRFDLTRPTNTVLVEFEPSGFERRFFHFDDNPRLVLANGQCAADLIGRSLVVESSTNVVPPSVTGVYKVDWESFQTNVVVIPCEGCAGTAYITNAVLKSDLVLTNRSLIKPAFWDRLEWLGASTDHNQILFVAAATNLITGVTNGTRQLYSLNSDTRELALISANRIGTPGPDLGRIAPAISRVDPIIAWESPDSQLVEGDLNDAWDVFERNWVNGEIRAISMAAGQRPAETATGTRVLDKISLSANGQRLAFVSRESSLTRDETNRWDDVFVRELSAGTTLNVTRDAPLVVNPQFATPVARFVSAPVLSANGRFIAFAVEARSETTNRFLSWRDLQAPTNRVAVPMPMPLPSNYQPVSWPVLSPDGLKLAFDSVSIHDPHFPDSNNDKDVFIYKLSPTLRPLDCEPDTFFLSPAYISTAATSSSSGWNTAAGPSIRPAFSPDSAVVVFESRASNLLESAISPTAYQLYGRTIGITNVPTCGGLEVLTYGPMNLISYDTVASQAPDGRSVETPLEGGGTNPHFSADSRFVVFESLPNRIYLHDLAGGFVQTMTDPGGDVRLTNSARLTNLLVCTECANPTLSANGHLVAFERRSSLFTNVVVKDISSGAEAPIGGNGPSFDPSLSYDGRFVVFASRASDLVINDNNGATDVFVFDRWSGVMSCLSRNWQGTANGNGVSSQPVMSADGRTVAFYSLANDLIPHDYNDTRDVFVVRLAGPDKDGDGLDDELEMAYFNTLERDGSGDFDGDGVSDAVELRSGTNPADGSSVLAVLTIRTVRTSPPPNAGTRITSLHWRSTPGHRYRVQFRENLNESAWRDLDDEIVAAGTVSSFNHLTVETNPSSGFYRVRWIGP